MKGVLFFFKLLNQFTGFWLSRVFLLPIEINLSYKIQIMNSSGLKALSLRGLHKDSSELQNGLDLDLGSKQTFSITRRGILIWAFASGPLLVF